MMDVRRGVALPGVKRGVRRLALVLLVFWVAAFVWFFGDELHLLFLAPGQPGDQCNDRLTALTNLAMYCNYVAGGDYPLFARLMFSHVATHLKILVGAPLAIWALDGVGRWVVLGFRST
jgi:hypothetical protein